MNKHKSVPNIRFRCFETNWREKNFQEILTINSGKDYKNLSIGNIPVYGTGGLMLYVNESLSNKDAVGIGRKGTINKPQYLRAPFWTVDTLFFMIPRKNFDISFIFCLSQKINWKKYDESTGLPSLSKKVISKISSYVPEIKEQQKIGDFFTKLDKLLDLQQQKINKLELLKKALLQKLFPKHVAKIPELRFKGYEGNWKKHKLKELASFLKGKGYSKNDIVHYGFPIILYGRMYTNYRLNIKFIDDTFVKNDKNSVKSVEGDVIIPASGETAEEISIASNIKRSGIIIGGDLNIIRPDNKLIDSSFLALVLSNGKVKQQIAKRAQGKSIVHIHNTDLMPLEIDFPSLNEQQKIGNLLSKVDQLIELENKKLHNLQQVKKCLLQNMFVE